MTDSVGLIGFGRMGQVLTQLLSTHFTIYVFDVNQPKLPASPNLIFTDLKNVLKQNTIFVCVPIRNFEDVIKKIASSLQAGTTIIDVCSVKIHPVKVMTQQLPEQVGIIATHPLFGPDSIKSGSLKMMMHPVRDVHLCYEQWKSFFQNKNIHIIEMTPEEHDRQAAFSQGITHFIGRVLKATGVESTKIDTLGFRKLLEVMTQTNNDSWDLFCDLQNFNPYSKKMIQKLKEAMESVEESLTQKNIHT